jgi:hypothetical protein
MTRFWRVGFSPRGASAPLPDDDALASLPYGGTEVRRPRPPGKRSKTVTDQLGGKVAARQSWSHLAPLRFPGDLGKCAPPRILVAKGRAVAPDAASAIAQALAVREQLDRHLEHGPVVAKKWRLRAR